MNDKTLPRRISVPSVLVNILLLKKGMYYAERAQSCSKHLPFLLISESPGHI